MNCEKSLGSFRIPQLLFYKRTKLESVAKGSGSAMSTFDVILHPTDFTEEADAAFHLACTIAREHHASLVVVHVLPPDFEKTEAEQANEDRPEVQQFHAAFKAMKALVPDLPLSFRLVHGYPIGMILNVAQEENAGLIVLASSHRQPTNLRLHGAVAEGVLRQSHCPVCCLREPSMSLTSAQVDSKSSD